MSYFQTKRSLPYIIIVFSIVLCIILGIWWLYLIYKLSITLHDVAPKNFFNMIIAEGTTFVLLQIITIISALLLFRNEHKKFISMQKFYAIFSHELKTPLTTLQLQMEILPTLISMENENKSKVEKVLHRLSSSINQLKYEVSKMLSLSQVALSPTIPLESLNLSNFLSSWNSRLLTSKKVIVENSTTSATSIIGNPSIIETVLNNLLKNSEQHVQNENLINLSVVDCSKWVKLTYTDNGTISELNINQLGELFYKSTTSQGTGIGLFIVKHLMNLINGKAEFVSQNGHFVTNLYFKKDL